MTAKSVFKLVFSLAIFSLLLLIGLHNRDSVEFNLPPVLTTTLEQPAAVIYFAFFSVGVVTGAIITAGSGKRKPTGFPPGPG